MVWLFFMGINFVSQHLLCIDFAKPKCGAPGLGCSKPELTPPPRISKNVDLSFVVDSR